MTQTAPPKKKNKWHTGAFPCRWPWLQKPDTAFKPLGEYRVDLIMPQDKAKALFQEIQGEVLTQAEAVRRDPKYNNWKLAWPVKDEVDEETEKPTGNKIVSFKQNAAVQRQDGKKDEYRVHVLDSHNQPIPADVMLGSGTVLRICFRIRVVASPISKDIRVMLHPLAAQVIQLVEWKQDFGFDEQDGYSVGAGNGQGGGDSPFDAPEGTFDEPAASGGGGIPADDIPFSPQPAFMLP